MGGLVAPPLFDRLSCRTTRLCFEVDGAFPHHEANPLLEENRRHIVERVRADGADGGIAWGRGRDRCFFIDGEGGFVPGDFVTALLAEAFLRKQPGSTIIYDVRASHAVADVVRSHGGTALMNRVGHAFFKKRMREEDAVFGGEVTGHYYFRDNYFADNVFIPALLLLELMSVRGETLSGLLAPLRGRYFISGEINTAMADMEAVRDTIERLAARYGDARVYRMDGVSAEYDAWTSTSGRRTPNAHPPQSRGGEPRAHGGEARRGARRHSTGRLTGRNLATRGRAGRLGCRRVSERE